MVAALRLSNRWEMWDMSSPRDPRRTDLYEDMEQGEKSRINTRDYFLFKTSYVLLRHFYMFFFIPFHKDLSHGITYTILHLVMTESSGHA